MRDNFKKSLAVMLGSFFYTVFAPSSLVVAKTLIFESSSNGSPTTIANSGSSSQPVTGRSLSTTDIQQPKSNPNAELFFMVEQLKREVLELRGIIEQQSYQLRNLEQSSKRRYQDIDTRVLNLTKQLSASSGAVSQQRQDSVPKQTDPSVVPVGSNVPTSLAPEPTEEQKQTYAKAYRLVKDKKFPEAVDALHSYIERFPEGELTGNAYYWLGEVYLVLPKLEQAKQSFLIVEKTFPGHRKIADALFKLAVTYDRLHDPDNSEKYLELVQRKYPDSTAAKLAKNYKIVR